MLLLAAIACGVFVFARPPIPQPLDYHLFADTRAFIGVPNTFDVLSNVPFAIVGIAGIVAIGGAGARVATAERWPYLALFAGVGLTAFGSAYYHLRPDNDRLVWDRLPMAVGFMGLLTAVFAERVSARMAEWLLLPLLLLGSGSVLYWHWTEGAGAGDLRLYFLVQFGSLVLVILMLCLYRARYSGTWLLVAGLAAYAAAKALELADRPIFDAGHVVSGHTLKHLAAAAGIACVVAMLAVRVKRHP